MRALYNNYFTTLSCKDYWTTENAPKLLSWSSLHANLESDYNNTLTLSESPSYSWVLYPNPTRDRVEISGSTLVQKVQLFSLKGKKVLEVHNTNTVSLKTIPQGMYLMKINGAKGTHTHKLIKQ